MQLDEDLTQCSQVHEVARSGRCPRHAFGVEQLEEALDDRQIAEVLSNAWQEASRILQTRDGVPAPRTPTWSYNGDGNRSSLVRCPTQSGNFLW